MDYNKVLCFVSENQMIERFLYVCQGDEKRTKEVMQIFFKFRKSTPEFFTNRDPLSKAQQSVFEVVLVFFTSTLMPFRVALITAKLKSFVFQPSKKFRTDIKNVPLKFEPDWFKIKVLRRRLLFFWKDETDGMWTESLL